MKHGAASNLKAKFAAASACSHSVFGAETHGWRLLAPLSAEEVAALERQHRVTLPPDYREFLLSFSAGGAGPGYGLLSFQSAMAVDGEGHALDTPFPWASAHDPMKDLADDDDDDDVDIWMLQSAGALALCHEGCGYYHRLIVTGPTRGTMWLDARCSDAGFLPLQLSFMQWYESWLDDILAGNNGVWWLRPRATA